MSRWRLLAAAAPLTAYALISRARMARWPTSPWAVAALFGPLLLTPLSAGLFFTVEHVLRYQRHSEFERASLAQGVQAWRAIRR